MNESAYWFLFISTAIILNISPGPDLLYLISKTMSYGKRTGFATMLGFGTGAMIHTLFVSLGISIIISKSILVFTIIKYIGAIYLFYLGIKTILSRNLDRFGAQNKYKSESFLKSYFQAIIIDITNPKVAIFFIALLPQFYRNNGSSQLIQFMTLGVIIVVIGFIVESLVIILLDKIIKQIKQKPSISYVIDKVFGGILIALGIRLILDKK
jgi:threonine/homoserine/homoserine lactone efflux protein